MKHLSPATRAAAGFVGMIVAVTSLSACGSDSDSTDRSAVSDTESDAALGPANEAKGEPVKLGFVNDGATAAIDTTAQAEAADAVVKYANAHLGGVGGRPIELVKCETKVNPATAADCGNQLVSAKVLAIAAGSLGVTDPVAKVINATGIPMVDILNSSPGVLGSDMNVTLSNPLNAIGGAAIYAKQNGIKQAVLVSSDSPASIEPAKKLGPLLFGNAGAKVDVVGLNAASPDIAAQIQAAQAKNPAQYHLIGSPPLCVAALKAIKSLGIDAEVTAIDRCIDEVSSASVPGGWTGTTVFTPANLDPTSDETKLYDAIRATFDDGREHNTTYSTGYQGMLGLIRALNASPIKDFTPAGAVAAIKSTVDVPIPLGGGATFTCDGKALPAISKAICSTGGITAIATAAGGLESFKTLTDEAIYTFPTG